MLEAMMLYLWGPRVSKTQKIITFDDDDCDMMPEFKEAKEEFEGTRKKIHPLIAQLKDRELKWSKMEKLKKIKR
jgi:hypothetical protein